MSPLPRATQVTHLTRRPLHAPEVEAPESSSLFRSLVRLADDIDARISLGAHSSVMAGWAQELASHLGLAADVVERARLAARFHDIGKVCVPDGVLTKPEPLTEEEWEMIHEHPERGAQLLSLTPELEMIAPIVRQHHERFDAGGYPNGVRGEGICVEARIVAVCDAWAAMLVDRPYRSARTVVDARAELLRGAGSQFDPAVVDAFLSLEARGAVGLVGARRNGDQVLRYPSSVRDSV